MCAAADVIPFSCLASANLADTAYFPGDKWRAATLRTLQNWCKHWKLPLQVSAQLPRWVDRQWELPQQTLQNSGQATWDPKAIADAIRPLRALVLGPADHFPNSLFVACPVYYHQLLCKTFGDPAVFQPCRNGTAMIVQHLRQDFESRHPELQVLPLGVSVEQRNYRPPGFHPKDPSNSVRQGRSSPTRNVGIPERVPSWLLHSIRFDHANTVSLRFEC